MKNSPDGIHWFQCVGTTAKWMTAAPNEAVAARRKASPLSVSVAALGDTRQMMSAPAETALT
jgi:hypothetical protein